MSKKQKIEAYYCKYCYTTESILENLDGIKLIEIIAVICPKCAAKKKRRKMLKINVRRSIQ